MKQTFPTFETERALCQAYARQVPAEWIVYPETCGWDMLLVHREGGWQIGLEAKLTLNAKVLSQAIDGRRFTRPAPDFRAVLVGKMNANNELLGRNSGPGFLLNDLIEFANNRPNSRPPSRTEILDAAKALKLQGWKAKDVTIDGIRHSSIWAPSHYTKVLGIGTAQDVSQYTSLSNFEPRG
jgi:hypothetical protein